MDGFFGDWMDEDHIGGHLAAGKKVCLVSPDLHRRDHRPFWDRLARMPFLADPRLMLCTDVPEEARAALQARGG
jgi:hypothetical protein